MKLYTHECVCDVCGEPGLCRPRDAGTQWLGGTLRHSDPQVCADNLRRQRERASEPCPSI